MSLTTARARELVTRGRVSAHRDWRDTRDRFVASDPGLARLRHATRAVVSLATTIVLQGAVSLALGVPRDAALLHVIVGGVIALNLATNMRVTGRRAIAQTVVLAGVGAALGGTAAVLAQPWPPVLFTVFVVVAFFAVWVRRFGGQWYTIGLVTWQAYFFAQFLRPDVSDLAGLLGAVAVSGAWVIVLLTTVLAADPEATLRRTVAAIRAQSRSVMRAALVLVDVPEETAARRLRAQLVKTTEVALLFDGQLSDTRALPAGVSPMRLRQWIVDREISVDEVAGAVVDLVDRAAGRDEGREGSVHTIRAVRVLLRELGWGRPEEARVAIAAVRAAPDGDEATIRRLTAGAELLLDTDREWTSGGLLAQATAGAEVDPEADEFTPGVVLQAGALPGSTGLAVEAVTASADQAHWWSAGRLRFTTRQAIQAAAAAALAIGLGELISPDHFYWAAIAAFITFTTASTTAETTRHAVSRTTGTLAGLFVSIALAHAGAGRPVLAGVIVAVCIFAAFYLQAISNAGMIFFLTVVFGQLYTMLHTFTDNLLLVRLAETAAGAFAGIVVTYAVLPAHARDTVVIARRNVLLRLADVLDLAEELIRSGGRGPARSAIYAGVVRLDEAGRQLSHSHQSLVRPRILDTDHATRRHRIAVLGACAATGRSLAQAALTAPLDLPSAPADVCRVLAAEARRLAVVPDLRRQQSPYADGPGLPADVATMLGTARDVPESIAHRELRLADSLALLTPRR